MPASRMAVVHAGTGCLECRLRRRWDHGIMHLGWWRHDDGCRSAAVLIGGPSRLRWCVAGRINAARVARTMGPFPAAAIIPAGSIVFGECTRLGGRLLRVPSFL
jgi:hypothetical protein